MRSFPEFTYPFFLPYKEQYLLLAHFKYYDAELLVSSDWQ